MIEAFRDGISAYVSTQDAAFESISAALPLLKHAAANAWSVAIIADALEELVTRWLTPADDGGGSIGAASKVRSLAELFTIIGTPTSSSSNSKPVLSLSSKDCFIAQHLVRTIERLMVIQARQDRGYDMKRNSSNTPYDDVFPSETLAIWTATSLDNGTDGNLTTNNSMLAEEERKSMRQSVKGIVATLQRIVSGESSSSTMAATIDGGQQQQFRPSVLTNSV